MKVDGARSALIVAIDDYADPGLRLLRAPARDAQALAAVLRDPEVGAFEVETLLNEPNYVVNVAVEEFFAERRPSDLLLVHFSCHGIKDEDGELHFATSNTVLKRLGATAVAAEFVSRRMSRSRSRRVVLLLDCCYAGAFERGLFARAASDMGIEQQFGGRGRAVITASSAMEYAFEAGELTETRDIGASVFTRALVKGLETGEADRDQDGLVGLDELYDYVYDKVRETTPNQTPGKWTFGIEGELYIARRNRPVTSPAPLPPELEHAIESPLAGIRTGAVQELAAVLRGSHAGMALAARVALERLAVDDSRAVAAAATAALRGKDTAQPGPALETPPPGRPEERPDQAPVLATSAAAGATPVVEAAPALAGLSPGQVGSDGRNWKLIAALLAVAAVLIVVATLLVSRTPAPTTPSSPPGFQVLSMTFVHNSQDSQGYQGFALGTVACRSVRCIALLTSQDGGTKWSQLVAPTRSVAHLGACQDGRQCVEQVRFVTPLVGYAYDPSLLMTTDGGQEWTTVEARVTSLEAAGDSVVWVASKTAGCTGQGYQVDSAPLEMSSRQALQPPPISTVCPPVLYRQGDRILLVGYGNPAHGIHATAQIDLSDDGGGSWKPVQDGCGGDGGYASAAALATQGTGLATQSVLVLLCQPRLPEPPGAAGRAWVRISYDDGGTFGTPEAVPSRVGRLSGRTSYQLAAASGKQLLVAETGAHGTKLLLTRNGGIHWSTRLSLPKNGTVILVGYEQPSIGRVAQGNTVWTTLDGGLKWTPDHFKYSGRHS